MLPLPRPVIFILSSLLSNGTVLIFRGNLRTRSSRRVDISCLHAAVPAYEDKKSAKTDKFYAVYRP